MLIKQYRGAGGLALVLGVAGTLAVSACGDSFTSCKETRTCRPEGGSSSEGGDAALEAGAGGMNSVSGDAGGDDTGSGGNGGESNGGESNGGESTAGAGCGVGMRCAPPVPTGWEGPFSADLTDSAPDCPPAFPELVYEGGSAPADEPATCGACQCENCTGGSCMQRLSFFTNMVCETASAVITPPAKSCFQRAETALSVKFDYEKDVSAMTCDVTAGSTETVPPRWLDRVRLCGGNAQVGQCAAAEVCVPALGQPESLCIVGDGNKSCPAGYPERRLVSSGFNDSRGCDCECMMDVTCSSLNPPFLRNTCGSPQAYTELMLDACVIIPGNQPMYSVSASMAVPAVIANAVPVGKVEAAGTISICCAP